MPVISLATLFVHIPNLTLTAMQSVYQSHLGCYQYIMLKSPDLPSYTNVWFLSGVLSVC